MLWPHCCYQCAQFPPINPQLLQLLHDPLHWFFAISSDLPVNMQSHFATPNFYMLYQRTLDIFQKRIPTGSRSSMKPWPFDLQKNLTVPSRTSSSILPFMETVLVLLVTMTSGSLSPGGTGDPGDIAMGDVISIKRRYSKIFTSQTHSIPTSAQGEIIIGKCAVSFFPVSQSLLFCRL